MTCAQHSCAVKRNPRAISRFGIQPDWGARQAAPKDDYGGFMSSGEPSENDVMLEINAGLQEMGIDPDAVGRALGTSNQDGVQLYNLWVHVSEKMTQEDQDLLKERLDPVLRAYWVDHIEIVADEPS